MANPGKPEAYEALIDYLKQHPIMRWACNRAGISEQSVHEMMGRNPEMKDRIFEARAIGQGKLIPHASPERVLSWSDGEIFGLRQEIKHDGAAINVTIGDPDGLAIEDKDA